MLRYARWSDQQEHTHGLVGVRKVSPSDLDPLGNRGERVALANDACVEPGLQAEDGCNLVPHHAPDGNAGPVGHDGGDHGLVDLGKDQRCVLLPRAELLLEGDELR